MKHTKLLVFALLVALIACLSVVAMADYWLPNAAKSEESTCYQKGWIWEDCKNDDGVIIDTRVTYLALKPHTWSDYVQISDATCVKDGVQMRYCTVCDAAGITHYDKTTIRNYPPATGEHDYQQQTAEKDSDCTTVGYKALKVCTMCGKVDPNNDGSQIAAKGHNFEGAAWVVEQEANCAQIGKAYRVCQRAGCGAKDYTTLAKSTEHIHQPGQPVLDNEWIEVRPKKEPTCTEPGCTKVLKCPVCGALTGGKTIDPLGHNLNVAWHVDTEATCAHEGVAVRTCDRVDVYGITCGAVIEKLTVPKATTHGDKNEGLTSARKVSEIYDWPESDDDVYAFILAKKEATCTTPACNPVFRCKICGKTLGGDANANLPATGHDWQLTTEKNATCTTDGKIEYTCTKCKKTNTIKIPAHGHYATWNPTDVGDGYTVWSLTCTYKDCDVVGGVLATQVVKKGETAPSGVVTTGKVSVDASYTNNSKGTTDVPLKTITKKSTATKSTSTKSTSTAAKTTTAAPKAATTTKVATVAVASALPANAAELKADTKLYVVKNVAGEDVVLNVMIADGKITVAANLAEGESVVLYADADAIANPTAENTLVLTANEAVELPEAFANAIIAVVKTDSLPAAVAAK